MRTKIIGLIIAMVLVTTGCDAISNLGRGSGYELPKISMEIPIEGPDGSIWDVDEKGNLIISNENETHEVKIGQALTAGGSTWEYIGFEGGLISLKPTEKEVDPMEKTRTKLD